MQKKRSIPVKNKAISKPPNATSMQKTVTKGVSQSENWKVAPDHSRHFSENQVIDAYLKGKDDGREQTQKALINLFNVNINKAGHHTGLVANHLLKHGFTFHSAALKAVSFDEFQVIITVKEEDILSDSFLKVYDFTAKLEHESKEELYHISFVFTHNKSINVDLLKSDGFIFEFKKKKKP